VVGLVTVAAAVGFVAGRRRDTSPAPRPGTVLPGDLEYVIDLARRANRALAGAIVAADGSEATSAHPRGVPPSVVDRALALARLARSDGRPQTLQDATPIVAVATDEVAAALVLEPESPPHVLDRVRTDLEQLVAGLARARTPGATRASGPWDEDAWLLVHESLDGAGTALCEELRRKSERAVVLVLRDDLGGALRVVALSGGADRRLAGTSALPGSTVARASEGDTPIAGLSLEELFGHPRADRRRGATEGIAFPVTDGRLPFGAAVVFGPPATLRSDARSEVQRLLLRAAPRLAHLQAVQVREQRAHTDELTGLPNRRGLVRAMATPEIRCAALLMLDLDHFKQLNDTHGHVAGDAALRHVAGVLARSLREQDLATRIGGEEFALWLPETPLDSAIEVAERVRAAVAGTPCRWRGVDLALTCSIGVAGMPATVSAIGLLYMTADAALYRAKRAGRNRVEVGRRGEAADSGMPVT